MRVGAWWRLRSAALVQDGDEPLEGGDAAVDMFEMGTHRRSAGFYHRLVQFLASSGLVGSLRKLEIPERKLAEFHAGHERCQPDRLDDRAFAADPIQPRQGRKTLFYVVLADRMKFLPMLV